MVTIDHLQSVSLRSNPAGAKISQVLLAALQAVEPGAAVARNLERDGGLLISGGRSFDLDLVKRVFIVGAGKAGSPMLQAALRILGERVDESLVIVKEGSLTWSGSATIPMKARLVEAGHPLPDRRGVANTQVILDLLAGATAEDLVICLISGGGSALLTAPVEGVTLEDLQTLTGQLLRCGASIDEINTLRKHLDRVKGGGLARAASPAQLLTLVLSDVVGSPLDVIASGPTTPDPSTFADCLGILEKYDLSEQIPAAIAAHLQKGAAGLAAETPKPGDPLFEHTHSVVIASNVEAAQAGLAQAAELGYHTQLLTTSLVGEASQAGHYLAALTRKVSAGQHAIHRPACLVAGGETTVTLQGHGLGGRNSELALAAVDGLAGLRSTFLITLATDGGDGPTDAAGAVVSGETLARAETLRMDPQAYLDENDSYTFFDRLGDLLKTGPTQTNVNDLTFIFVG